MESSEPRSVGTRMVAAVAAWAATLDDDQRRAALRPGPAEPGHDAGERQAWFYTPTDHGGLALGAQRPAQRRLAMQAVAAGLSEAGFGTVMTVIGLENILDRHEGWVADWGREHSRDTGSYWMRVYGEPGAGAWAWRFGGHHVSLNYALLDRALVSATPCFIGADPAASPLLGGRLLRPLGAAEDLARTLLTSLDAAQREQATLHPRAPSDIIGGNRARLSPGDEMIHMNDAALWGAHFDDDRLNRLLVTIDRRAEAGSGYDAADHRALALTRRPRGISGRDLSPDLRLLLRDLLDTYVGRVPLGAQPGLDLDEVHFAWAGDAAPGRGHYYRLQGPDLLVEYDNTQRGANHVHSVWRAPETDFGPDELRRHRRQNH